MNLGYSNLFTLVGNNFVRKNSNNKNRMTVEKEISRATKLDQPRFSIFFWFRSYGLSKVCYYMVVVGFGTFQTFHFGWLQLRDGLLYHVTLGRPLGVFEKK